MKTNLLTRIGVCTIVVYTSLQIFAKPPIELGSVSWQRDLSSALNKSSESGKPVFLLFQEVPGCATCSIYGREILSHPLLVEAIEDLFEPVFVYNNRSGSDKKIRNQYQEPSWNFPVVRYLKSDGTDLIPRRDRIWKIDTTLSRMVEALKFQGKKSRIICVYLPANTPLINSKKLHLPCTAIGRERQDWDR